MHQPSLVQNVMVVAGGSRRLAPRWSSSSWTLKLKLKPTIFLQRALQVVLKAGSSVVFLCEVLHYTYERGGAGYSVWVVNSVTHKRGGDTLTERENKEEARGPEFSSPVYSPPVLQPYTLHSLTLWSFVRSLATWLGQRWVLPGTTCPMEWSLGLNLKHSSACSLRVLRRTCLLPEDMESGT